MVASEIELAIARHFGYRQNLIVPNVSFGLMGIHECDMLILSDSGYASEIEIKVSLNDLKKDLEKRHGHYSNLIKKLYFAIPEKLIKHINVIPDRAGVLIVKYPNYKVELIRAPKINKSANKFSFDLQHKLAMLGCMRIWSLKETLNRKIKKETL